MSCFILCFDFHTLLCPLSVSCVLPFVFPFPLVICLCPSVSVLLISHTPLSPAAPPQLSLILSLVSCVCSLCLPSCGFQCIVCALFWFLCCFLIWTLLATLFSPRLFWFSRLFSRFLYFSAFWCKKKKKRISRRILNLWPVLYVLYQSGHVHLKCFLNVRCVRSQALPLSRRYSTSSPFKGLDPWTYRKVAKKWELE